MDNLFLPNPNWYVRRVVVRVLYFFERFFHVNFKHMTRMTWKKSSNFSRTSYLYLVNGYLKATFCQHWFKHPAAPIEIFSALDQETMVTRLIFNMSRVKKSCWFKKEGVLLYYIDIWICISDHIYIHVSVYQYIFPLHGISGFTAFNRNPHIRPLYFAHQRCPICGCFSPVCNITPNCLFLLS